MIQILKDSDTRPWFFLQTAHTTYGMWVMETGHLEHLYYGERITVDSQDPSSCAPLVIQRAFAPGNTCTYDRDFMGYDRNGRSCHHGDWRRPRL